MLTITLAPKKEKMTSLFGRLDGTVLPHARRALCLAYWEFQICCDIRSASTTRVPPVYEPGSRREDRTRACVQAREGKPHILASRASLLGQSRNGNLLAEKIVYAGLHLA